MRMKKRVRNAKRKAKRKGNAKNESKVKKLYVCMPMQRSPYLDTHDLDQREQFDQHSENPPPRWCEFNIANCQRKRKQKTRKETKKKGIEIHRKKENLFCGFADCSSASWTHAQACCWIGLPQTSDWSNCQACLLQKGKEGEKQQEKSGSDWLTWTCKGETSTLHDSYSYSALGPDSDSDSNKQYLCLETLANCCNHTQLSCC